MMGAAVLATKAALRSGAGKVKALVPQIGYNIIQTTTPEAMCMVSGENHITKIANWADCESIGIGPGLGTHEYTIKAFTDFMEAVKQYIVLDADALNIPVSYTHLDVYKRQVFHISPSDKILPPKDTNALYCIWPKGQHRKPYHYRQ